MNDNARSFSPFRHPVLRAYLNDVLEWHGYMRTLGMPTMKDNPSVPIDQLYIAPALSRTPVSADAKDIHEGEGVLALLEATRRLLVLGDPGSGKSTLVNWLAWRLAAGLTTPLPSSLQGAIPIPLVLRELDLKAVDSFDSLLTSFLMRPSAAALKGERSLLAEALREGRALVLVDGLDEVPENLREKLVSALKAGFSSYPEAAWLITSRIVGFDEKIFSLNTKIDVDTLLKQRLREGLYSAVTSMSQGNNLDRVLTDGVKPAAVELAHQFLREIDKEKSKQKLSGKTVAISELLFREIAKNGIKKVLGSSPAPLLSAPVSEDVLRVFVQPFDDKRVEAFSRAWYRVRGSAAQEGANCDAFLKSVRANAATQQLARNPQVLTLMALVFRARLELPQGRALLYEYIAQAYLESIDKARGLADDRFSWQEKKRWLGKVGFEMQLRRVDDERARRAAESEDKPVASESSAQELISGQGILFSEDEVVAWVCDAMRRTRSDASEELARAFLDNIARRSGLLLPRGVGQYAFVHLTFQEYFAALYLKEQVCSPSFAKKEIARDERINKETLFAWSGEPLWHEAILFLHELAGNEPEWAEDLDLWTFGPRIPLTAEGDDSDWYRLDLRLAVAEDVHTGLNDRSRRESLLQVRDSLVVTDYLAFCINDAAQLAARRLLKSSAGADLAIEAFSQNPPWVLWLENIGENALKILQSSSISSSQTILSIGNSLENLDWLKTGFANLRRLFLSEPAILDISLLATCKKLRRVLLNCPNVVDVSPLAACSELMVLELYNSSVRDLSPLMVLPDLVVKGNLSQVPESQRDIFSERERLRRERIESAGWEQDS